MWPNDCALMRVVLCIVLVLKVMTPALAQDAPKGDPARGMTLADMCVSCHGWSRGPDHAGIPILAGQNEAYLVQQLLKMRRAAEAGSGRRAPSNEFDFLIGDARTNHMMDASVVAMTRQDLRDVSAFFAEMRCERRGAPSWQTAPPIAVRCAACHGAQGISEIPNVPTLAGQDELYLYLQLQLFRDDQATKTADGELRRHSAIMRKQMKMTSAEDIKALARYYSELPCSLD